MLLEAKREAENGADNDSKPPIETEIVNVDTAADMLNTSSVFKEVLQ